MSKYPNLRKISVLYVEDDENIQKVFTNILKRFITKLYIANNGAEGLKKFEELKPDLIITDIQMPKMNGIEMIANIRKENKNIPIIITTAFNDINYAIDGIKLGIEGFFLKPIEDLKSYLDILENKAKIVMLKKENEKKEKIIDTIMKNFFDIAFFVEKEKIIKLNEKAQNIIKNEDINEFLTQIKPNLTLKKIEEEIIEYKNHFYSIKIDTYSEDNFIIIMTKLT
jgi:two-component system cell cycle response regulator